MSTTLSLRSSAAILCLTLVVAVTAFFSGREHSRKQIRDLAEAVADAQGTRVTNTFGRCLTELWEQTGELDPQWKGKRGWALTDRSHP